MARIKLLTAAVGVVVPAVAAFVRRRRSAAAIEPAAPPPPARTTPPGPATAAQAAPPPEAPGPSVTAPGAPGSETEREEQADALKPEHLPGEPDTGDVDETRVDDETAAAGAEAAAIGGPAPRDSHGEAMRPVYEAGGGEQEGFESAEEELVENASHGNGRGDPLRDAFPAETESDLSDAEYSEADTEHHDR